jgi:hypothetical protein
MYIWYNNLLRFLRAEFDEERSPFDDYKRAASNSNTFPFKTTLHVLNSAIIKLSRTQKAERVYRGTKVSVQVAMLLTATHLLSALLLSSSLRVVYCQQLSGFPMLTTCAVGSSWRSCQPQPTAASQRPTPGQMESQV